MAPCKRLACHYLQTVDAYSRISGELLDWQSSTGEKSMSLVSNQKRKKVQSLFTFSRPPLPNRMSIELFCFINRRLRILSFGRRAKSFTLRGLARSARSYKAKQFSPCSLLYLCVTLHCHFYQLQITGICPAFWRQFKSKNMTVSDTFVLLSPALPQGWRWGSLLQI